MKWYNEFRNTNLKSNKILRRNKRRSFKNKRKMKRDMLQKYRYEIEQLKIEMLELRTRDWMHRIRGT